ncbi:hypothetical protein SAMN03159338_1509 [Sphingomonas sp. NFR04]|uniref:hypothetical protein n=1 Tax=Sphingomonas sp. NFR04 TaxID=1566283 RepID=UPI0008E34B82|nr:hypothetical protein [Sphingomonas sp. NFR04]SFJ47958.1 hypothetical protein SAMN03159338_1509 [Sphingomonas sp. NFR04]
MRSVRIVSHEDDNGNLGLVIKGTEITPGILVDWNGGLLPHDLLEHQNGIASIGCPADELEALGGLWQVRGRWGTFGDRHGDFHKPTTRLGHNIAQVADDLCDQEANGAVGWWPGTRTYCTRRHEADMDFADALDVARHEISSRMEDRCANLPEDFPVDQFIADARHLLRRGYRKAHRRFGDGWDGYELFMAVKEALRPIAAAVSEPGLEFVLRYGRCQAIVTPASVQ